MAKRARVAQRGAYRPSNRSLAYCRACLRNARACAANLFAPGLSAGVNRAGSLSQHHRAINKRTYQRKNALAPYHGSSARICATRRFALALLFYRARVAYRLAY